MLKLTGYYKNNNFHQKVQQSNNTYFMYCCQQIPQYHLPLFLRTHSFNGVIKISLRYIPLQTRKNKGEERKYVRGGE